MSDRLISTAVDAVLAFAFPQGCHVCGAAVAKRGDGVACAGCWEEAEAGLLLADRRVCARCGAPGAGACITCAPDDIAVARSTAEFAGAVRAAVLDLKRRPHICTRLATLFADSFRAAAELHDSDMIVPVPLHPSRLAERGHNQAELLATSVGRAAGIPVEPAALARTSLAERRRAGAGRTERATTVRGAFRASRGIVAGLKILLVDDLYTTGATAGACAGALRDAGASDVRVLTAARVLVR